VFIRKKYVIFFLLFCMGIILVACTPKTEIIGTENTDDSTLQATDTIEGEEIQNVYITCAAAEGLSAYSLTKILYEQPTLTEGITLDYKLYNDVASLKEALSNKEPSIAVLPFTLAIDTLVEQDDYKLLGVAKGNNHLLLGIESLYDVKGKSIKVYDPSGYQGLYSSSIKRLTHDLALKGLILDRDYTLSYIDAMEDMVQTSPNDLLMIEEVYLDNPQFKSYNNYVTLDEVEDYQLAVIVQRDAYEVYPELVSSFNNAYYRACIWLSANPERAIAYAMQIDTTQTTMPVRSIYYFNADKSINQILQMIDWLGYRQNIKERISNSVYKGQ